MFHNEPLKPPHWTLTSSFRAFCTTWVHLGQFGSVTTLSTKWAKFLATTARDPPHWTLNSYFGVFFSIWMHLGPFGCLTKLSAKRAELVQNIVPRSRVIIFRNEHTRLSPFWPKLMFWCVSYYLGAFGTVFLPYNAQCKTGQLVQLFVLQSRVGIFRNERTRSTPLDSKLLFSGNLFYFGAFGTIWLPYKTRCRTGRTGAKVHATKSHRNFSRWKHPIRPIGS